MQSEDLIRRSLRSASEGDIEKAIAKMAKRIAQQNRKRKNHLENLALGEPIWDVFLDIYLAEKFDLHASVDAISERTQTSVTICRRCINYLLQSLAIVENSDQYSASKQPFVLDKKKSIQLSEWLKSWFDNGDTDDRLFMSG